MFPVGVANLGGVRNEISLRFRTRSADGILLYYINAARTDLLAIELRGGVPWFVFDAGTGPGAARPQVESGTRFDDGDWHILVAFFNGTHGTITVDGVYSGVGESRGSSQVISSNQVLYVGGIPTDIPRTTVNNLNNSAARVSGRSFSGCLFGVVLKGETLDFSLGQAVSFDLPQGVGFEQGCPVALERGNSFIGGGYVSLAPDSITASSFSFTFSFRTTHNKGLLLFLYSSGGTAVIAVEIRNSTLNLLLSDINGTDIVTASQTIVCDGEWHSLLLDQTGDEVFLAVDGEGDSVFLSDPDTIFSSSIFIGGVPTDSMAYNLARSVGVNVYAHFSGCTLERVLPSLLVNNAPVVPSLSGFSLVRFDGCVPSSQLGDQESCTTPWTSSDVGNVLEYTDENLTPFSG